MHLRCPGSWGSTCIPKSPGLGTRLTGESGRSYMICEGRPTPWHMVWAKDLDQHNSFTVWQPASWATTSLNDRMLTLKRFEDEKKMSKIFKDSKRIWRSVDTIEPTSDHDPPTAIYRPMGDSLSALRVDRLLTRNEVKSIMKSILLGLQEIESKGFVYAGLNAEDVLVSKEQPSQPTESLIQLWATEQLLPPFSIYELEDDYGDVYCAPELYFHKPCSFRAHIWSWGMILTHLLESRASWMHNQLEELWVGVIYHDWRKGWPAGHFDEWGWWQHDLVLDVREKIGDFGIKDCEYFANCEMPKQENVPFKEDDWKERLLNKGLRRDDVCFLDWVLNPNPETRPTSEQILQTGYLEWNEEDDIEDKES